MIKFSTILKWIVVLQLFIFGILTYFLMIRTEPARWAIDVLLYCAAIMIFFKRGIKKDRITLIYVWLLAATVFSFMINSNELVPMLRRVRFTLMGGVVYVLFMNMRLSKEYFDRLIKLIFYIGYAQFPIAVIQLLSFEFYKARSSVSTFPHLVDYVAGTLGWGDSAIAATFLVILSIVKIQEGLSYGFNIKKILQVVLLLAPLGLINSDAQFLFLPLVVLAAIVINKKINLNTIKMIILAAVMFAGIDFLIAYNTKSGKTMFGFLRDRLVWTLETIEPEDYEKQPGNLFRVQSMAYVIRNDIENPSFSILIGKGPGYWLDRGAYTKAPITKVWYHCNTVLLVYAELGLLGLLTILLIPVVMYFETDNSFWGKVIKVQSFYIIISVMYNHPLNRLSTLLPIMIFLVYFKRYHYKKTTIHNKNMVSIKGA